MRMYYAVVLVLAYLTTDVTAIERGHHRHNRHLRHGLRFSPEASVTPGEPEIVTAKELYAEESTVRDAGLISMKESEGQGMYVARTVEPEIVSELPKWLKPIMMKE